MSEVVEALIHAAGLGVCAYLTTVSLYELFNEPWCRNRKCETDSIDPPAER